MTQRRQFLISLLSCLLLPAASGADLTGTTRTYQASAYDLEGGELLYVERHVETWRAGRLEQREVSYEDARGDLIAEKTVLYGDNLAAPSFEMTDYRNGLRESATVATGVVDLFSGEPEGGSRARTVALPEDAVIDAGFDAFMRNRFAEILEGSRLEFEFAVPAARRFFKFQLVPEGRVDHASGEAVLVRMKPASRLLRLVLDPIDLIYDRSGRLLEFRGLSNVCDEQGDRYKTRIVFDYPSEPASNGVAASIGAVAR